MLSTPWVKLEVREERVGVEVQERNIIEVSSLKRADFIVESHKRSAEVKGREGESRFRRTQTSVVLEEGEDSDFMTAPSDWALDRPGG